MKRPIHIKRVRAEIRLVIHHQPEAQATTQDEQGDLIEVRVLLNDISPGGMGIYAADRLNAGQSIEIILDEPKQVRFSGKVVWCQEQMGTGAVLSSQSFNFRTGVKFEFATPEDEQAVKAFCEELQQNYLYSAG